MEAVRARISNPTVLAQMEADPFSPLNDPAGDNYHYYRGTDYDKEKLDVLTATNILMVRKATRRM